MSPLGLLSQSTGTVGAAGTARVFPFSLGRLKSKIKVSLRLVPPEASPLGV